MTAIGFTIINSSNDDFVTMGTGTNTIGRNNVDYSGLENRFANALTSYNIKCWPLKASWIRIFMEEEIIQFETPNWSELDIELSCPRCSYNLKMLTLPRCPECGFQFQWDELIRAKKEFYKRPPIFEYHWRDHPIRSFALTIWMCLQPWRLWRWLPLSAVPSIRVLPILITLVIAMLALVSASVDFIWHEYIIIYFRTFRGQTDFSRYPWYWYFSEFIYALVTPSLIIFVIWCSIQIFRQTIARYRIRQSHLLRIVVYSWIGVVGWQFLGEFVSTLLAMPYLWFYHRHFPSAFFQVVDATPLVVLFLSLGFGFQSYLRVRGGWLWAMLLLAFMCILIIIVGLIVSTVIFDTFNNHYWDYLADWSPLLKRMRDAARWLLQSLHGY